MYTKMVELEDHGPGDYSFDHGNSSLGLLFSAGAQRIQWVENCSGEDEVGRSLSLPSPSENGDGQDDGDEILEGKKRLLTNLHK